MWTVFIDLELIPRFSSIFDNFQMGSITANPIKVDNEEDKENSAPTTTKPGSERPTEPTTLLRSRPFGTPQENVPDSVYRTLFLYNLYVLVLDTLYVFCRYK